MELKYLSLFILTVQNASQVLLIRYARTRATKEMFLSTSAVLMAEIMKLTTCLVIIIFQEKSIRRCLQMVNDQMLKQPWDTLKVCVPSIIYTMQNNLLYVAVSNLAAATFLVTYQLKILTTAVFSVIMLRKPLSRLQWLALILLFAGVSLVQLNEQQNKEQGTPPKIPAASNLTVPAHGAPAPPLPPKQEPLVGFMCVIIACMMSGFSGIYFEKILKGSGEVSVWMRNVQLAILSIPISWLGMMAKDGDTVKRSGVLFGYDSIVWTIVALYALGGLTVAVVIKYADNILKGFATSFAIILSCIISVYLFDFQPSTQFLFGTTLVIVSIYIYSKFPANNPK